MKTSTLLMTLLATAAFSLMTQGCSTAKVRILPGEDGNNQVVSRDIERDDAEEAAADEAKEYCEKQGKKLYVVKEEKTAYQGSMDEDTRKTVRNASTAAILLGGPTGVLSNSAGVGGAVAGAGMAGHAMTSDRDYEARFTFTCK